MKKVIAYILIFILVIIVLPNLCTKKRKQNVQTSEVTEEQNNERTPKNEKYDYSKYKTIKLYHSKTGQTEELNLDDYLYGVVSSEMPANFEKEALKAQAIVARTYTIYQISRSKRKTRRC